MAKEMSGMCEHGQTEHMIGSMLDLPADRHRVWFAARFGHR
jgi:hypothetical protein